MRLTSAHFSPTYQPAVLALVIISIVSVFVAVFTALLPIVKDKRWTVSGHPEGQLTSYESNGRKMPSIGTPPSAFTSFSTTLDRMWVTPGRRNAVSCRNDS